MALTEVSYTVARRRLAELWDRVLADREPIRLTRRGTDPVVLLAADEFDALVTTVHLLERARAGVGRPRPLAELRAEFDRAEGT
jgi:prevent-host-death family protein